MMSSSKKKAYSVKKGTISSIKYDSNRKYYHANFHTDNNVLKVFFQESVLEKTIDENSICKITEDAILDAEIKIDYENDVKNISILGSLEEIVELHNQSSTALYYVGTRGSSYRFRTEVLEGVSLSVYVIKTEMNDFFDKIDCVQKNSKINSEIIYKENRIYPFILVTTTNITDEGEFYFLKDTTIDENRFLLFKYNKSPGFIIRIPESSFFSYGIYNMVPKSVISLQVERNTKKYPIRWEIAKIYRRYNDVLPVFPVRLSAVILNTWNSNTTNPSYIMNPERSMRYYAFKNHCIAKTRINDIEFLVVISKELLISKGFWELKRGKTLELEVLKIVFPIFNNKPINILCADNIIDEPFKPSSYIDDKEVIVELVDKIESSKEGYSKYRFKDIGTGKYINFTDRKDLLSNFKTRCHYNYIAQRATYNGNYYIRKLLSASLK